MSPLKNVLIVLLLKKSYFESKFQHFWQFIVQMLVLWSVFTECCYMKNYNFCDFFLWLLREQVSFYGICHELILHRFRTKSRLHSSNSRRVSISNFCLQSKRSYTICIKSILSTFINADIYSVRPNRVFFVSAETPKNFGRTKPKF